MNIQGEYTILHIDDKKGARRITLVSADRKRMMILDFPTPIEEGMTMNIPFFGGERSGGLKFSLKEFGKHGEEVS